jgi:hypothetical protein
VDNNRPLFEIKSNFIGETIMKFKRLTATLWFCITSAAAVAQAPYDQCPPGYMMQSLVQPNGYSVAECMPMQPQPYPIQPYYGVVPPPVYLNPVYPGFYRGYEHRGYYGREERRR